MVPERERLRGELVPAEVLAYGERALRARKGGPVALGRALALAS
jgi:hypothetical protein